MKREDLIRWAAEVGAHRYTNRHLPGEPAHAFSIEQLEAFYHHVAAHILQSTGSWVTNAATMAAARAEAAAQERERIARRLEDDTRCRIAGAPSIVRGMGAA